MLKIQFEKHGQTLEDLRRAALQAPHARTRERFLALYEIAAGVANAAQTATRIGRHHQTVLAWVHSYNERGPGALTYRRTGGSPPFARTPSAR